MIFHLANNHLANNIVFWGKYLYVRLLGDKIHLHYTLKLYQKGYKVVW